MFWHIFEFIVLVVMATAVAGTVKIARHVVKGASLKAQLETKKVERQVNALSHDMLVEEHHRQTAVLALTTGSKEEKAKKAEEAVREMDGRPEVVKGEAEHPPWKAEEGIPHWKLRASASDAEFKPVRP